MLKVYFSMCFTFFCFFTNPYKQLVYRQSQGRKLTVQSELKMPVALHRLQITILDANLHCL